jgi:hypothetical protein
MNGSERMLRAVVLGSVLVLGAGVSVASCGDDDDDENVPATQPGATEQMTDTTEMMTETTEMMTDTTG